MDFGLGAKLAGARFVVLRGDLAKLERAIATLCGYAYAGIWLCGTSTAILVRGAAMAGTGQLRNLLKIYSRPPMTAG